jgi:hypothetical protein
MFRFFIGETPFVLQLLFCRLPIKYATGNILMAYSTEEFHLFIKNQEGILGLKSSAD